MDGSVEGEELPGSDGEARFTGLATFSVPDTSANRVKRRLEAVGLTLPNAVTLNTSSCCGDP